MSHSHMASSAQKVVAKALWAAGNERIGHRSWETVRDAYMAEAGRALSALAANGFVVVPRDEQEAMEALLRSFHDEEDAHG